LAAVRSAARNALGILADLGIAAFGLALAARGLVLASSLPLLVAAVDLMSRLGVLPFARSEALSARERGDLVWGTVLALAGTAILLEEAVALVDGGRGTRHVVTVALGAAAEIAALVFFTRLARSRARARGRLS
jgi:hypothetical protein